jgi:ABC-type spermidine/putrescine transport system permease subunit I
MFLLFFLILPSWTSIVVQLYSWFFLLSKDGIFTKILQSAGIIPESLHFLYSYPTIIVGMVATYLPFMIFPIYAVLERIDKQLLEVAADLGANGFQTFKMVTYPLSLTGVYTGVILVFAASLGEFAIPALLGGEKYAFWGTLIVDRFLQSHDWESGGALAVLGIFLPTVFILSLALLKKLFNVKKSIGTQVESCKDCW